MLQADEFEAVLKAHFSKAQAVPCWYPGSKARYQAFLDSHPESDFVESTIPEGKTYGVKTSPIAPCRPIQ
jgi:hypothetical protein